MLLLIYSSSTGLLAQEAVTTAGGDATDSGGSISYSIGQVIYTTNNGLNGSGAQGVQQPIEFSEIEIINDTNFMKVAKMSRQELSSSEMTTIEDHKFTQQECSIYPNPTTNRITLEIKYIDINDGNLTYQLFDINGSLIESKKVENTRSSISMVNLVPGTYLLYVIQGNKSFKNFKIIKN